MNLVKILLLSSILAATSLSAAEVTIIRDEHGTPHVYSENTY